MTSSHPRGKPAIDKAIAPQHGVSRDGQPLSYNRAPPADLEPWVGRLYVSHVDMPVDYTLACGLFNDTAMLRVQLQGDWTAQTADGERNLERAALFFGPHSKCMPISVSGPFISLGVALRPGACTALRGPRVGDFVDRLAPAGDVGLLPPDAVEHFDVAGGPECWLHAMEEMLRIRIETAGDCRPDPISTRFEFAALDDPSITVADFSRTCGVDRRTVERIVRRDFGMTPKQVLRRARALDMASHLRGVADSREANDLLLRYYDESHLIHEFTDLFGIGPRQFAATPQPILTLALESRQARRLELLKRLAPGQSRPWE